MKEILKEERRAILRFLAGVFLLMWVLTAMTPMFADDYFYVLHLGTEEPLRDFADVLDSISGFRRLHNGRIAAHFCAQLFLLLPDWVFPLVNAAICTLLFYIVYRYIRREDDGLNRLLLFSAFAMVWVLLPGFGHCFLWLTGSCSYLWAITVVLLFLWPFYRAWMQGPPGLPEVHPGLARSLIRDIARLGFAFLAGSWSENGSFSMLAAAFCFLLLFVLRERRIPGNLLLRFAAACGGFLYLMLAPTELGKKNKEGTGRLFPLLEKLGLSDGGFVLLLTLGLLALGGLFLLWYRGKRRPFRLLAILGLAALGLASFLLIPGIAAQEKGLLELVNGLASGTVLSLLWLLGGWFCLLMWAMSADVDERSVLAAVVLGLASLASLLVFLVAIYFPARAVCVATLYLTIADLLLLGAICRGQLRRPAALWAGLCALLLIPTLLAGCADIKSVYEQSLLREERIAQAQAAGADFLELEPFYAMGKYSTIWPQEQADYYYGMQNFYGIESIIITGAEEF